MMDVYDAAEMVKQYWLRHVDRIPERSIALAKCPYCGKTDRIRLVEAAEIARPQPGDNYQAALQVLSKAGRSPGICGFCLNVVRLYEGQAEPLQEP